MATAIPFRPSMMQRVSSWGSDTFHFLTLPPSLSIIITGLGFSSSELRGFYSFSDKAFHTFQSTGKTKQFKKAESLLQGNYGGMNPGKDYLYLRLSQDQPFNILYLTPALTTIMNLNDRSVSISPELLYTGVKNWEFRLKGMSLVGSRGREFGEKQNDYRIEFRVRYYFSLPSHQ